MVFGRTVRRLSLFLTFGFVALACTDDPGPTGPDGPMVGGLEINVAPLNLQQIGFACFDIKVFAMNYDSGFPTPELVWERGDFNVNRSDSPPDTATLCSNVFGNGQQGDIVYVGTCDATHSEHVVQLVVDGLYTLLGARINEGSDWQNPCPPSEPCEYLARCTANTDTPVVINLTVLRSANQGFFDIAVRFNDIFCSAKVDCSYDVIDPKGEKAKEPIMLVHNADGEPDHTAVIGLACTAGPGKEDKTEIHFNAPRIECGNAGWRVWRGAWGEGFCHAPYGDAEVYVGYEFQAGRDNGLFWQGLDLHSDFQHLTYGGNGTFAAAQTGIPMTTVNTGESFVSLRVREPVGPDMLLLQGYMVSGPPPWDDNDIMSRPALLTRAGPGAPWNQLWAFPGLGGFERADARYDPLSQKFVVQTEVCGPCNCQYSNLIYAPSGAPGDYQIVATFPATPGVYRYNQSMFDGIAVFYEQPDTNCGAVPPPDLQSYRYSVVPLDFDPSLLLPVTTPNVINPNDLTFVNIHGVTWSVAAFDGGGEPRVLGPDLLLTTARFNGSNGNTMYIPVELRIVPYNGTFAFEGKLAATDPPPTTWHQGPIPPDNNLSSSTWLNTLRGNGFSWATGPWASMVQKLSWRTNNRAPYGTGSPWRTWNVAPPNGCPGVCIYFDEIIESPVGHPFIVVGRHALDNARYWGYLPHDGPDVVWLGMLPALVNGGNSGNYQVSSARRTDSGLVMMIQDYDFGQNIWIYSAIDVTFAPLPAISTVTLMRQPNQYAGTWAYDVTNQYQYRYDARHMPEVGACAPLVLGGGYYDQSPLPGLDDLNDVLAWDTTYGLVPVSSPPPVNETNAFSLGWSTDFQDHVDAQIALDQALDGSITLYPNLPEGYAWAEGDEPDFEKSPVFQYGVYYGDEELMCGDEPCNKKYMNFAIGIRPEYANCMLAFEATAAPAGMIDEDTGWATPDQSVYPVITFRVNLTPNIEGGDSWGLCGQNPLGGKGSGVQTLYTRPNHGKGFPFCFHLDSDGIHEPLPEKCEANYPYINGLPLFAESTSLIPPQPVPAPPAEIEVQEGFLTTDAPTRTIAQMARAFPDCGPGLVYVPERFACVGICGDGIVAGQEACDDRNTAGGDGCSATCQVELQCGDSTTIITEDKLCDGVRDCPLQPGFGAAWDEREPQCFSCGRKRLSGDAVCDGVVDCDDGRDERSCPVASPALPERPAPRGR